MQEVLVNLLFKPVQEKRVVRCTDHPNMTIAVAVRKATNQTNFELLRGHIAFGLSVLQSVTLLFPYLPAC